MHPRPRLLPASAQAVRQIDCVLLKGSAVPLPLYTYDCGEAAGYVDSAPDGGGAGASPDGGGCTGMSFPEYRALFKSGVDAYLAGRWGDAATALTACAAAWPSDRPAALLLEVMAAGGGAAPPGWAGGRELQEK